MRKQFTVAASILVMLAAAASAAFSHTQVNVDSAVASAGPQLIPTQADHLIARLSTSPASVHLARPL